MFSKRSALFVLLFFISTFSEAGNLSKKDSLLKVMLTTNTEKEKTEILLNISKTEEGNNTDSALVYANRAYQEAKSDDNEMNQVIALSSIARYHSMLNNFTACVQAAEEGIPLARKHKMKRYEAILKGIMGVVYAETGNADKSARFYFEALTLFEEIGDQVEIGLALGNLGADFLSQKSYDKALKYMSKSLEIAMKIGDRQGVAQQYNNMGGVYLSHPKNNRQALEYFKKALSVNNEIKDGYQAGINLINIGIVYEKMNMKDSALRYYQEALNKYTILNHPLRKADCLIHMGMFFESNHPDKCFSYAHEALGIGQKHNSLSVISSAARLLHNYYLNKKDTARAYIYSNIQHSAADSLHILQNQKSMFKLEFQYNQEKIDKERQLNQQRRTFLFGFIIFSLLTGLVILFLIYSRQRIKVRNTTLEKEKAESMLRFKNKELSINLMALLKKNELIEEISERLIKIEKENGRNDARESIAILNKELKMNIDDRIWKEFSTRFNETNHEFYEKLQANHPGLTQNELKLCAYLRLNMTTKEISDLTGQRTESIEVARYRLRKKLGIANSDSNLVGFLSQI